MASRTSRRWRSLLLVVLGAAAALFVIDRAWPADVRPDGLVETSDDAAARALLAEVRTAHGAAAWEQYSTVDITFRDVWPFWLTRTVLSPWSVPDQQLLAKLRRRSWTSELTLLNGEKPGARWGLQSWRTWKAMPDGDAEFDDSWLVRTTVAGLRYFLELPLAMDTATFVRDAGQASYLGKPHRRLYVTWNESAPQRDFDQYVLWIDPDTHRVARVDFTIRALSGLAVARATVKDYQEIGGVSIPREIVIDGVLPTGHTLPVHTLRIEDVAWDITSIESLAPDPTLTDSGESKPLAP